MGPIISGLVGFGIGWLVFKRPELAEKIYLWVWEKIKCIWHKVF